MSPSISLADYPKRSDAISAVIVTVQVAFAVLPLFLAAALGIGWHLIPCALWFGLGMDSVLNLMHEASHYHVFRPKWASDILGRWLLGPLAISRFRFLSRSPLEASPAFRHRRGPQVYLSHQHSRPLFHLVHTALPPPHRGP